MCFQYQVISENGLPVCKVRSIDDANRIIQELQKLIPSGNANYTVEPLQANDDE